MKKCVVLSFGELALKKDNRNLFERRLLKNIKNMYSNMDTDIQTHQSKVYIYGEDILEILEIANRIFGIATVSIQYEIEKDIENIKNCIGDILDDYLMDKSFKTFKVESKRTDKSYPFTSPEISRMIGGHILKLNKDLEVDVNRPDFILNIEIRHRAFVSFSKMKGAGGLPVGIGGKALSLLSGGIDSPVSSILAMKRGIQVDFIHFHSYPYTSKKSLNKTIELAELASKYQNNARLFVMNLLPIQEAITKNANEKLTTILQRRSMLRISEKIAEKVGATSLVTGENLGQVASQTLEAMQVTSHSTKLLMLRPLITFDKLEIIDLAKKYKTYEKSIEPFEDCCTVFVSKHPKTHPKLDEVLLEEAKYNYIEIEDEIIEKMEEHKIK